MKFLKTLLKENDDPDLVKRFGDYSSWVDYFPKDLEIKEENGKYYLQGPFFAIFYESDKPLTYKEEYMDIPLYVELDLENINRKPFKKVHFKLEPDKTKEFNKEIFNIFKRNMHILPDIILNHMNTSETNAIELLRIKTQQKVKDIIT